MSILFVGKSDSQSSFRQALDQSSVASLASLGPDGLQSMHRVCQQYQWVVLDVQSSGVGRDAAPFLPACSVGEVAMEAKPRRGCTTSGLEFEYQRAEIISYHRPRQR